MSLVVDIRQQLDAFDLDATFSSDRGVTALFGRSGSGKTSLVRAIAGLSKPDNGRLVIDGDVLVDTQRRIFVPKHKRRFGYVFQEGRLFPHLSVRQNLLFGRWFAQKTGPDADFSQVTELLGIGALLDRRPGNLSGGEKQRVAIGRALLSAPRLLLMDEPLAALDEQRKAEILPYLERLRDETSTPIIYVSHSLAEVTRLADCVVMLRDGRVDAVGSPADVFGRSGMSSIDRRDAGAVLSGRVEQVDRVYGLATIRLSSESLVVPNAGVEQNRRVRVHIPERDVMIATQRPEGLSALNILEGRISSMEPDGEGMTRVRVICGGDVILSRITAFSVERLQLVAGMPVFAVIKTVALEQ